MQTKLGMTFTLGRLIYSVGLYQPETENLDLDPCNFICMLMLENFDLPEDFDVA